MRYNNEYYCMGTLYCVSTPIGNLEDITLRAVKTLFSVDVIACEDTRHTGQLLAGLHERFDGFLGIDKPEEDMFIRYDDHVELTVVPELIDRLQRGQSIALVTDAGTPAIADPGFLLIRESLKRGIRVVSIPGASAVLTALTASGLPATNWMFLGFPPEKPSHRLKFFAKLKLIEPHISPTYICYVSPYKLLQTLADMQSELGNSEIVIARELTKIHEEIWRGSISEALKRYVEPKGEFVLLFRLNS